LTLSKGRKKRVRPTIRYSEAFKLQVLRELEEGKFPNRSQAAKAYGIRGRGVIRYWARQYGKDHLIGKVVRVETPKEVSEVQALRQRVRELEKALADAHIESRLDAAYLGMACRAAGIEDVDGFKKKHAGKR
jgi:transposase-like protein